jgi:hypothetical protein
MKKALVLVSLAGLLAGVSGCSSGADQLVKDQIRAMNDLADALEAKAPPDQLLALQNRLREITDQWKALNLSDGARKEVLARHQAELTKAGMRLGQAALGNAAGQIKAGADWLPQPGAKLPR